MKPPKRYNLEIIATGNEILYGRITDTNSPWIARKATESGASLRRITCIGDDTQEIAGALRESMARANNLIISTGGLGPSQDDMTIESIGKALGRNVELNPKAVEMIQKKCLELGVEPTPRRLRMARMPEGSTPLSNSKGMAPGMLLQEGSMKIVALPGIPDEMKAIFQDHVVEIIERETPTKFLAITVGAQIVWKEFFPIYESLIHDFPEAYIKNKATPPIKADDREKVWEIKVDVVVEAASRTEAEKILTDLLSEFGRRVEAVGGKLLK